MTPEFRAALPYLVGAFVLVLVGAYACRNARWANMTATDFVIEYNRPLIIGLLALSAFAQVMSCGARCHP